MDSGQLQVRKEVISLYEERPYPPIGYWRGLLQGIRWEERQTLNYRAVYGSSWGSTEGASPRPRILVAGCGTFEPIVVALANPWAEIVAIDLSARSLDILKWHARIRGVSSRILCFQGDFQEMPSSLGQFDYVIATGVIHHLPDPEAGLKSLLARTGERSVFRFMVYSRWGRSLLYAAKELAIQVGVKSPREFRKLIDSLPPDHPYKIYFHLYIDSRTDGGLADGFLHPCDHALTARELALLLARCGLVASGFLHGPEGQPEAASSLASCSALMGDWDRLALLEAYGELQENFRFLARRSGWNENRSTKKCEWNEALPERGKLYSRMLGRELAFDKSVSPAALSSEERRDFLKALFLLPGEDA